MNDLSNESVSVGFWSFLRKRPVQGLVFATLLSVVLVAVLGGRKLPFDRPAIGTTAVIPNLITQLVQIASRCSSLLSDSASPAVAGCQILTHARRLNPLRRKRCCGSWSMESSW